MKLDRNINSTGRGKYGLVNNRKLAEAERTHSPQGLTEIEYAISVLEKAGILDWGLGPNMPTFPLPALVLDDERSKALFFHLVHDPGEFEDILHIYFERTPSLLASFLHRLDANGLEIRKKES